MDLWAYKRPNGFQPVGGYNEEQFDKLKNGQIYKIKATKERDKGYHRKVMSMLRCAFDYWDPDPDKLPEGVVAAKDFDVFRHDLTKAAGFYDTVWHLDGTFEIKAKSIAFDKMDQPEFEEVAEAYIQVIMNSPEICPQQPELAKSFRELIASYL